MVPWGIDFRGALPHLVPQSSEFRVALPHLVPQSSEFRVAAPRVVQRRLERPVFAPAVLPRRRRLGYFSALFDALRRSFVRGNYEACPSSNEVPPLGKRQCRNGLCVSTATRSRC